MVKRRGPAGLLAALVLAIGCCATAAAAAPARSKVRPDVVAAAQAGDVDVLIVFRDRASLQALERVAVREQRIAETGARLRAVADASQRNVRALLARRARAHRPFWVVNAIAARLPLALIDEVAADPAVQAVVHDRAVRVPLPGPATASSTKAIAAITAGVTKIHAPELWALGFRGEGIVVAGADTGVRWDHEALIGQYRGWDGVAANHDYAWHDAIHALIDNTTANPCGLSTTVPCDDNGHGTHTIATAVGDNGPAAPVREQVGVAPAAKWIACRNMERGNGRPSTYIECFQWFLAPTDSANLNPDPARAPHVINNSWACPPFELCDPAAVEAMRLVVENVKAAGILVVVSAGNSGSACETITDPPAIYPASFTVGATNVDDTIASFSSRGLGGTYGAMKPDVVAPGVGVRSAVPDSVSSYGNKQGTSMAGPHVAGAAALLMDVAPALIGAPVQLEALLRATAEPLASAQSCPNAPGGERPNAVFGHGRVDVYAAGETLFPVFSDEFE